MLPVLHHIMKIRNYVLKFHGNKAFSRAIYFKCIAVYKIKDYLIVLTIPQVLYLFFSQKDQGDFILPFMYNYTAMFFSSPSPVIIGINLVPLIVGNP